MKRNILKGVKPFNTVFYKSCYNHQLLAGLSILGVDSGAYLLNEFVRFDKDFAVKSGNYLSQNEVEKTLGYSLKRMNINLKKLIRQIDRGRPVIVGVDSYELESRPDFYHTTHGGHFVLAYGYDLTADACYIVDHRYAQSFRYEEKVISLKNLLEANRAYNANIHRAKTSAIALRKRKAGAKVDFLKLILENKRELTENRENVLNNFLKMKEILGAGAEQIELRCGDMLGFVEAAKDSKQLLLATEMAGLRREMAALLDRQVSIYSYFKALLHRMTFMKDYVYIESRLENVFRKIDSAMESEREFYGILLETEVEKDV